MAAACESSRFFCVITPVTGREIEVAVGLPENIEVVDVDFGDVVLDSVAVLPYA